MIKLRSSPRADVVRGPVEIPETLRALELPEDSSRVVASALRGLKTSLGENLRACILNGSAVRGKFTAGVSDLNLLIVLRMATPEAVTAVAESLRNTPSISPMVIGGKNLERAMRAFALKFLSIARNYKLLVGEDVLAGLRVEPELELFLAEQELRNLRSRLDYAFIRGGDAKMFGAFLARQGGRAIVCLSDLLRAAQIELPHAHSERVPIISRTLGHDAAVLHDLLNRKAAGIGVEPANVPGVHAELHRLLDRAIEWLEERWPNSPRP